MATVTKPYTFAGGTTILASEVNSNFDTIISAINGGLDGDNLANSSVDTDELVDGAVDNSKVDAAAAIAYSKLATLTANRALVSNGSGIIEASSITSTELSYLSGVTSSIQTQLNTLDSNKQDVVVGVSDTEISYLDGVTSNIQTQINTKVPNTRNVSAGTGLSGGGDLSTDRTLSIADGGVDTDQLADGSVTDAKLAETRTKNGGLVATMYAGEVYDSGLAGTTVLPSGWSFSSSQTGVYRITHNLGRSDYIVVPGGKNYDVSLELSVAATNFFEVHTYDLGTNNFTTGRFNFMLAVPA